MRWFHLILSGWLPAMSLQGLIVTVALTLPACEKVQVSASEYVDRARTHLDQKRYQAAAIELKNALRQDAGNTQARWLLGTVSLELGQPQTAAKELRQALRLGMPLERVAVPLGRALLSDDPQALLQAESLQPQAIAKLPASARIELLVMRGEALFRTGQAQAAAEAFNTALAVDDQSPTAWRGQALLAFARGELTQAAQWLERLLAERPKDIKGLALQGDLAMAQDNPQQAVTAYRQAVAIQPHNVGYQLALAKALWTSGEMKQAKEPLSVVLKTYPNLPSANYMQAVIALQASNNTQALQAVKRVLDQASGHHLSRYVAGLANYRLERFEQAHAYLEPLSRQFPDNLALRRLLAATQVQLGTPEAAAQTLAGLQNFEAVDSGLLQAVGSGALRSGDLRLSAETFQRVVNLEPDNADALIKLGLAQMATGETEAGLANFAKAKEFDAARDDAEVLMVAGQIEAGEYDAALKGAKQLQASRPDQAIGWNLAGIVYTRMKQFAKAETAFARALEIAPGDRDVRQNYALLLLNQNKLERARSLYTELLEENPASYEFLMQLAALESKADQFAVAADYLKRAIEQRQNAVQPRLALAEIYFSQAQLDQVITVLAPVEDAVQQAKGHELLGLARLRTGRFTQASQAFAQQTELQPKSAIAWRNLALAYQRGQQPEQAIEAWRQALELEPKHGPAQLALARLLVNHGDLSQAEKLLQSLQRQYIDNPNVADLAGAIALKAGRAEAAVKAYRRAFELRETNFQLWRYAGAVDAAGQSGQAIDMLADWLQTYPQDLGTRLELANAYLIRGQFEPAEQHFRKLLEQRPEHALARNNLAWLLHRAGDSQAALPHAERAYALAPESPDFRDTYGTILLALERHDKAREMLEVAVEQRPDDPNIQFHYAQALAAIGNTYQARRHIERALASERSFGERAAAEALLEKLESNRSQ